MSEGMVPQTFGDKLDYVCRMTERMIIKLFGEVDSESATGRLPILEATQKEHDKRIRSLEKYVLYVFGAIGFVMACGFLIEAIANLSAVVRR